MPEEEAIPDQRAFFQSGTTRSIPWRKQQLRILLRALDQHQERLLTALHQDLGKPPQEAWISELGYLRADLCHTLRKLRQWSKPRRASTPAYLWPARSRIVQEPLGTALVIGAWNYPLQLSLAPAIAAIAAGNCVVIKPSELAPHTARAIADLVASSFPPEFFTVCQGDHQTAVRLVQQQPDIIFFTGGPSGGSAILHAAAPLRIPCILELGGKSPAIVGPDAPLSTTAQRVAWGKFLNAGQTCIAPDHLWVHSSIAKPFINELRNTIQSFYGKDPSLSPDYARICRPEHLDRLVELTQDAEILHGGNFIRDDRYFEPTLLGVPKSGSRLATEEIFGPLLPIQEFNNPGEIVDARRQAPIPLALYLFTQDRKLQQALTAGIRSAGVCINDTICQILPPELPFGGLGGSGFGRYHGKTGFEAFSHPRPILERSMFGENTLRYPPAKWSLATIERLFRILIERRW